MSQFLSLLLVIACLLQGCDGNGGSFTGPTDHPPFDIELQPGEIVTVHWSQCPAPPDAGIIAEHLERARAKAERETGRIGVVRCEVVGTLHDDRRGKTACGPAAGRKALSVRRLGRKTLDTSRGGDLSLILVDLDSILDELSDSG